MSPSSYVFAAVLIIATISSIHSYYCSIGTITKAQYDALQLGWTRDQVTAFVGNPGDPITETANALHVQYRGTCTEFSFGLLFFTDGKLSRKDQSDLC